jgi:hypothetical protein
MSTKSRPIQDRRKLSRVQTHLGCQFTFEGIEYEAFILDVSLAGAFLWSAFMPPWGASISIRLKTSLLENPLILEGQIVRRDCKQVERGTGNAFAIRFSHSSPGLIVLINKLVNPPKS